MFARRSKILVGAQAVAETPLLLPSFSSKGFPQVKQIMDLMAEFITTPILISSYDVYHRLIPKNITFSQVLFLDSGGYEAKIDHDLSESYGKTHRAKPWNRRLHERVLGNWSTRWPTIAVSFDSPVQLLSLSKQIRNAAELQARYPHLLWEFLLKPESTKDSLLPIEKLIARVTHLAKFAVVGLTEKELGDSVFDAMTKIARLRIHMDAAGVNIPIHIFGSLDALTTVLYFLAGAEIFDGLTSVSGYHDGKTVYSSELWGTSRFGRHPAKSRTEEQHYEMWRNNYYYLLKLRTQIIKLRGQRISLIFGIIQPVLQHSYATAGYRAGGDVEMGGSGGRGFFRSRKPEEIKVDLRKEEDATLNQAFDVQVAEHLGKFVSEANERDTGAIRDALREIKTAMEADIEGTLDPIFGGSIPQTYLC